MHVYAKPTDKEIEAEVEAALTEIRREERWLRNLIVRHWLSHLLSR